VTVAVNRSLRGGGATGPGMSSIVRLMRS